MISVREMKARMDLHAVANRLGIPEWPNRTGVFPSPLRPDRNPSFSISEKDGEFALVEGTPEQFRIISKFKVPLGADQHWAHPVIANKKLYIRHNNALMVYDIHN